MADKIDTPEERTAKVIDMFDLRGGESRGTHRVMSMLRPDAKSPYATTANALAILSNDPPLSDLLGFNEFTGQYLIRRAPPVAQDGDAGLPGPYPRPWDDPEVALLLSYVQRVWCQKMTKPALTDAMIAEASRHRFHPVRDWLASLRWDGEERIDTWLRVAFGAIPPKGAARHLGEYIAAVGAKLLIASVRRVRQPGCKYDQLVVLEGGQGLGKSRAVKALYGREWFSDSMHPDFGNRDAPISMRGAWGIELAEIAELIRNGDEVFKAFMSRPVDRYRPIHGKFVIDVPRQCVLVGTTNATDYLRDTTGNRRIWPVRCEGADVEWIEREREQLWAEAAHREAQGEPLYLDESDTRKAAEDEQSARMIEDTWTDRVLDFIAGKHSTTTADVLGAGLNIPLIQQDRKTEMRIAGILKSAGWTVKTERIGGRTPRVWRPKDKPELPF
jgi:putative DNA primase/helicase